MADGDSSHSRLTANAARPNGHGSIKSDNDLSEEERTTIVQMIKVAIQINEPTAAVTANMVDKVFRDVFTLQWFSTWPPSPPVEKERRLQDTSIQIGVWSEDLPAPTSRRSTENDDARSDEDTKVLTPRKRARTRPSLAAAELTDRKRGAPAFIRPRLRECGLIDIWFTDGRGRRAPDGYVEYWGGEAKITGDTIARAASHYDDNEICRVNDYNRSLLVYLIRQYIYRLVTGHVMGSGPEEYKYIRPSLIGQGLETCSTAWGQYKEKNTDRAVGMDLIP